MASNDVISPVVQVVERAKELFRGSLVARTGTAGLSRSQYHRYLSMQYHLTKDVQRHILAMAGHPTLARRRALREFLFTFAQEEEMHYLLAEEDLRCLDLHPLARPLDVALWQSFFLKQAHERPFLRLGVTCVLENLGAGAGTAGREILARTPFLNRGNTRFLEIHFHEVLPHGEQVYEALRSVTLSASEIDDLRAGAAWGATFYLRLVEWIFEHDPILAAFETGIEAPI